MTQPPQDAPWYKVFLMAGSNDFLRTRVGEVRLFDDITSAQASSLEAGGGIVLPEGASAPAGFDRPSS